MEMDSFWVPTFHQAPVGPVDRRKKNKEEHWTFSTVLWVSASHPPPSQELSTKTKIVLFYSNLEAPESRRFPSTAGEPPAHPIRPPGPPSNSVSSGNDQQVGEGDPRLQASEKSHIKPLPFLFSPSFLLPISFPLPSASSSSPPPLPHPLQPPLACLHFFVISASSLVLSPPCLLCSVSPTLFFIPLCFSPSSCQALPTSWCPPLPQLYPLPSPVPT